MQESSDILVVDNKFYVKSDDPIVFCKNKILLLRLKS